MKKCNMNTLPFSKGREITTLVENRRAFTLNNFELNIYETYQESRLVPLKFNDVVIVNMLRGKKIMHLEDVPVFEYLPGETLILPKEKKMEIDFPEAKIHAPTQCTALTVSKEKIDGVVEYLNDFYPVLQRKQEWGFRWDKFHFDNDTEIALLANRLFQIAISNDVFKQALADLALKELLIRIMQTQNLLHLSTRQETNDSVFSYVKDFIQRNLAADITVDVLCKNANMSRSQLFRDFKQEFGITPMEYVIRERIAQAKRLLAQGSSVKECSYSVGFNDVNYFVRSFKKREGVTPGAFQANIVVY